MILTDNPYPALGRRARDGPRRIGTGRRSPTSRRSTLSRRVRANVKKFQLRACNQERRAALRCLCSILACLEEVAISAAVKVHGAPGQLDDEIVHKRTFEEIALSLGGIAETPAAARELVAYVHSLPGRAGAEATNILAEVWVTTLFSHLKSVPELRAVLKTIQRDEDRHIEHAKRFGAIVGFDSVVWQMESLLQALTATPAFALPLMCLLGLEGAARVGLDLLASHNEILREQGLTAGPDTRAVRRSCRAAIAVARSQPRPVEMSNWDRQRQELHFLGTMDAECEVRGQLGSRHRVEARVVMAVASAMAKVSAANRTLRAGLLYEPFRVCVGVRRLYRDTKEPVTIQVANAHLRSERQVIREIARRLIRANNERYPSQIVPRVLMELAPPSRYAMTLSFTGAHANNPRMRRGVGFAPLVDGEGCAGSVTVGSIRRGVMSLGFRMDHRHFDGAVMVRFMEEVADALEAPRSKKSPDG